MNLAPALLSTLQDVSLAMRPAEHRWWIIGSAAIALHGIDPGPIGDVDVLFDPRDAERVLLPLGLVPEKGEGNALFRSQAFAIWRSPPLHVEMFAGFELCEVDQWSQVRLETRESVMVAGQRLWVPSVEELHTLLLRFGRPKDLARAALLSPSGQSPSRSGIA